MGIGNDMKNLTQEILDSYQSRVQDIAVLKKEVAATLKDFHGAHIQMSAQLKDSLTKGEGQRLEDFKTMEAEIKKRVKTLKKETDKLIKDFHTTHTQMSAQLKDSLAKGETQRLEDFKAMEAEIRDRVKTLRTETDRLLKDFDTAHAEMSVQLNAKLAQDNTDRANQMRAKINEIQREIQERVAEISKMLREFQNEREKMRAEWQKLEDAMGRERGKVSAKLLRRKETRAAPSREPSEATKMVASPASE